MNVINSKKNVTWAKNNNKFMITIKKPSTGNY